MKCQFLNLMMLLLAAPKLAQASNAEKYKLELVKGIFEGKNLSQHSNPILFNGNILFSTEGDGGTSTGYKLWTSDGSEEETKILKNIEVRGSIKELNGKLFFRADDGVHGLEVWVSDGTEIGTKMLRDINAVADPSFTNSQSKFYSFRGNTLFVADDGINGVNLWETDGSEIGTNIVSFKDKLNQVTIDDFFVFNDILIIYTNDAQNTYQLWFSDGSVSGTVLGKTLKYGLTKPNFFAPSKRFSGIETPTKIFFGDGEQELWVTDGSIQGTRLVYTFTIGFTFKCTTCITTFDGRTLFIGNDSRGNELWSTDGTPYGTALVKDIFPGSPDFENDSVSRFGAGDNILVTPDFVTFWQTDGTAEGTDFFMDLYPPGTDILPRRGAVVRNEFYFAVLRDDNEFVDIWVSDGTVAGTVLLRQFDNSNNTYFFKSDGGDTLYMIIGEELWKVRKSQTPSPTTSPSLSPTTSPTSSSSIKSTPTLLTSIVTLAILNHFLMF
jgi:ELWxxDGT repeat protein